MGLRPLPAGRKLIFYQGRYGVSRVPPDHCETGVWFNHDAGFALIPFPFTPVPGEVAPQAAPGDCALLPANDPLHGRERSRQLAGTV